MRWLDTQAIVVGRRRLSGADRLVTLLTPEHGRMRAVARGDCLPRSRQAGALEPYGVCRVILLPGPGGGGLFRVDAAERVRPFLSLTGDLIRCQGAGLACAWVRGLSREGESRSLYHLLEGHLAELDAGSPVLAATAVFLWRLPQEMGVAPQLDQCADCGCGDGFAALRVVPGAAVCGECRKSGDIPLTAPHWAALRALANPAYSAAGATTPLAAAAVAGGCELASDTASDTVLRRLAALAQVYLRGHFGAGLP
ncbi:MAG: DNA repair protein RecO [Nitrospirota bacterium]|nr:DNA repair protein RecO [Nitrospirota bacterium]